MIHIPIDHAQIAQFCHKHGIRKLSFFGSVLRDDFSNDSDVDVLVEFETDRVPGFLQLAKMAEELSPLLSSRTVDLRTPEDLSRYFRDAVVGSAEALYVRN